MKKRYLYSILSPLLLFLLLFELLPLADVFLSSLRTEAGYTLGNYETFFQSRANLIIYLRTLRISIVTTVICIAMGFPAAYYISRQRPGIKGLYMALTLFPLLTSSVVRSFSWMVVLGAKGVINSLLIGTGLIEKPLNLLYNEFSIVVGLVHLFLPLMILSLVGVMENIDDILLEAAENLGSSKLRAFLSVVFPLSVQGVVVGSVLVFTGSATAYTTPQLLGSNRSRVMATLLKENTSVLFDWEMASAISVIMIVTTFSVVFVMNRLVKSRQR